MPNPGLSRATKALRGTLRAPSGAAPAAGERLTVPPPPPAGLGAEAAEEWRALAPVLVAAGTLAASDLRALRLLCETLATEAGARAVVGAEGFTVPTADGGQKPHPAVRIMETSRAQAAALLRDFGLTPRARGTVDAAPGPLGDDPAAAFFR
jgi:P27 family predicted phage terminase small subunit